MPNHRVVIIGGGFGGLYAAQALEESPVDITLIDRRNFHLFQPLLYQVATGTLAPGDIAFPLRLIVEHQQNIRVLLGDVVGFDISNKSVMLRDGGVFPYDTLILASGSEPNYFGHDEWRTHAPGLKTVEDATSMRSRILMSFEQAERESDPEKIKSWLTFLVVGAGPTGVELAGALAEIAHKTLRDGFRHISPSSAKVFLIDAVELVLPGYPAELSKKAKQSLEHLGVTVRGGCKVTDVKADAVMIEAGGKPERIPTRTVLWTAGVRASPLGQLIGIATGAEIDRGGRVVVNSDLSVPGHPELFVIGDLANPSAQEKQTLPGVAPVAMQQGRYVAQLIEKRLVGKTVPAFKYHDRGSIATIGRNRAVANLGWIKFSGFFAWLAWAFIHIVEIIEFENKIMVILQWGWNYVTWNRTDLLITQMPATPPPESKQELPSK